MSKNTASSMLLALVLAVAVFLVALALMLFVGHFRIFGAIFMAFLVGLVAAVILLLGFGTPSALPAATARPASAPETDDAARAAAEAAARQRAKEDAARRAAEEAAATAATADAPVPAAAAPMAGVSKGADEGTRPAGLDAPRGGNADDLKQIKGIGPKMEKLCNSLGFWHFDQIASWTPEEVAWVDASLEGFKGRVTRDKWVEQAKILGAGGETEFSKRVEDGDVY
jgi:predicted flap endonuclease-1-like 5' DNA nuclease